MAVEYRILEHGVAGWMLGSASIFPRICDSHWDKIQASLNTDHFCYDSFAEKQPVAWTKEWSADKKKISRKAWISALTTALS